MRLSLVRLAVLLLVTAPSVSSLFAQSSPCSASEHRQFDFWLGDWDVFDRGASTPSARARVTSEFDGCVVREVYDQVDGLHGESLSSYDAKAGQWQQTWVTNRGQLLVIHGKRDGTALAFDGWTREGVKETLVRARWVPDAEGVRETAERSTDGGRTWTPWFDVVFRKRAAGRP